MIAREALTGITLGAILGLLGFLRVLTEGPKIAFAVALTLICVVTIGTVVGSALPLFFRRLGLDPAVSSSPFIASLVDVLGIVAYFSLARMILGL